MTPVTLRRSLHTSTYEILDGWWTDAGTFESLLRANNLVAKTGANKLKSKAYSVVNYDKLTYAGNLGNLDVVANDSHYRFFRGDICDPAAAESAMQIAMP